jgi:restriction endonuclease S subunit
VEEILNKELRLKDLDLSTQKTFEAKFSEIWDRIDPEYYQPIFNEIEKIFKKQKTVNLGDISLEIKYGTSEDLFYVEKGIPFLRVTDINKFSNIEPIEGKFINNFDAERLKEYQVETDDIIISRTGTLGLAVYIDEKLDGAIYGSYFIKVKPRHKDLNNRFITFFISSKIGRLQTNRWASGGIQTNLTIDAIKSIRIPILSWSIQQKIVSLIQESFNLRREAKELIDRARKEVEEMVEND